MVALPRILVIVLCIGKLFGLRGLVHVIFANKFARLEALVCEVFAKINGYLTELGCVKLLCVSWLPDLVLSVKYFANKFA